ncbi:right-handed parallel beta-helix repeat-containing protein [Streptomyces glaucosporus]|uniref:Right-handed parallel beta-helix repeat-containing protein n=1 Tax=Streptomyces glaucosporus TaxID=284044 RepID=A0ABP5V7I1_9ACTN
MRLLRAATVLLGMTAAAAALPPAPTAHAATVIVVAVNGDDAGAGTAADPLATVQEAVDRAAPGDTITVRGGTYVLKDNITIGKSGTASAPITLTSHNGERVIIDGERLPASHTPVGGGVPRAERGAIHLEKASHWRISGLEIVRGPYGVYADSCSDNVFDRLVTRDNYETGFQLQGASSRNTIRNLDSYGNRDPRKNGESADGLGIKEGSGTGNRVVGARLWNNVDDGFDAWEFTSPIRLENTVAHGNGFNRWNFPDFAGDGNGFKMGGGGDEDPPAAHTLHNSASFGNAADGVTDNGNPGALKITRTTAFRNGATGFDIRTADATVTGNLSVEDRTAASLGGAVSASGNSWQLGGTWNAASVRSTDPSVITGPRASDGSIRPSGFLVPANGAAVGARF